MNERKQATAMPTYLNMPCSRLYAQVYTQSPEFIVVLLGLFILLDSYQGN